MSEHPCDSDTETVSAPGSVIIIDSDDNNSQHLEGMFGSVHYFKQRSSLALLEKTQFLMPSIDKFIISSNLNSSKVDFGIDHCRMTAYLTVCFRTLVKSA